VKSLVAPNQEDKEFVNKLAQGAKTEAEKEAIPAKMRAAPPKPQTEETQKRRQARLLRKRGADPGFSGRTKRSPSKSSMSGNKPGLKALTLVSFEGVSDENQTAGSCRKV
jgi:hypothetical protein